MKAASEQVADVTVPLLYEVVCEILSRRELAYFPKPDSSKTSIQNLSSQKMISASDPEVDSSSTRDVRRDHVETPTQDIPVTLLTGGIDRPYAFGLSMALASRAMKVDIIGDNALDGPEIRANSKLKLIDLFGDHRKAAPRVRKLLRVVAYYCRLIRYTATSKPKIFHILWNYKFRVFDRTLLMLYYKALGKKIVFTAHNVNAAERDGNESSLNRFSLRVQYRLADHIFVHTDKMRDSLLSEFGVREKAVSVIPFGINNSVPDTSLTPAEAKKKLGLKGSEKALLFFGRIRAYKGLDYLIAALQQLLLSDKSYRLIIAGEPKKESAQYWAEVQRAIEEKGISEQVIQHIGFIADEDTELYFKAADVSVLPYTGVFQSGVLFLSYSFGLPVIATDVGSLREDIIEGETGYLCRPCDTPDLSRMIEKYFQSDLYKNLDLRRLEIRAFANAHHSWDAVSDRTRAVYSQLLETSVQ